MKERMILHSLNGLLEDDLELHELEKRLEMLALSPAAVNACDDFWCDDNSDVAGQTFAECDDYSWCDDHGPAPVI